MKRLFTLLFLSGSLMFSAHAQELRKKSDNDASKTKREFKMPAASPSVAIEQAFSTSFIKLEYSRPSVKNRKVFGDMIPYGQVWRTGANSTSKITFGEPAYVGETLVKPGTYSIYTIPGEKEWVVMLNTDLDNWGAAGYDAKKNVAEMKAPVKRTKELQETFSISIENMTKESASLVLAWEHTVIEIPLKVDNRDRIMEYLKKELEGDNPPYAQAAGYYLETGTNMKEALRYIEHAIKDNPSAYYLYWTQARIYEELGENDQALRSADRAAAMAKKSSPAFAHEYERNFKEMSNRLKK